MMQRMATGLTATARRLLPPRAKRAIRRLLHQPVVPPIGRVRFGDLRRTTPIANDFGYGRGGPVDRLYIEAFLERHRADVQGRVLEIGDDAYTRQFGDDRVRRADVLHVDPDAAGATFVGDLADGSFLPASAFQCVILTQTLHLIYDFHAALRTVQRVLAPGGVLLMTVPGITNIDPGDWGGTWHYSFSHHALRRLADDHFAGWDVEVSSYGNVLTAVAFLHGLGRDDLEPTEIDEHHVEYSLINTLWARKPAESR